jgi:hypothetical protein
MCVFNARCVKASALLKVFVVVKSICFEKHVFLVVVFIARYVNESALLKLFFEVKRIHFEKHVV